MLGIPSRIGAVTAAAALTVLAAACGSPSAQPPSAQAPAAKAPAAPRTITEPYAPMIDPANFSTTIDNPFFPLVPGTRLVYDGNTPDGREHDVVEVTAQTKTIMGVQTRVVHDVVTLDGKPSEETLDWYAQARDGSVWYFGEQTSKVDGATSSTKGSFVAGENGALPGIIMPGAPAVGDHFRQEYLKGVAEDTGKVLDLAGADSVPYQGAHTGLVVTEDVNPLDPTAAIEHKAFARGVGLLSVTHVTGEPERVELVSIEKF